MKYTGHKIVTQEANDDMSKLSSYYLTLSLSTNEMVYVQYKQDFTFEQFPFINNKVEAHCCETYPTMTVCSMSDNVTLTGFSFGVWCIHCVLLKYSGLSC